VLYALSGLVGQADTAIICCRHHAKKAWALKPDSSGSPEFFMRAIADGGAAGCQKVLTIISKRIKVDYLMT